MNLDKDCMFIFQHFSTDLNLFTFKALKTLFAIIIISKFWSHLLFNDKKRASGRMAGKQCILQKQEKVNPTSEARQEIQGRSNGWEVKRDLKSSALSQRTIDFAPFWATVPVIHLLSYCVSQGLCITFYF